LIWPCEREQEKKIQGSFPLHSVQGQDDGKNKQPRRDNTEILATPECDGWELAFDDAGWARDSRMGQRRRLAGVHAEEGKDRLTDAVRQQDARGQRRKDRTHQNHRITHRIIPLLSSATHLDAKNPKRGWTGFIVTRFESVAMKLS
jgi:hypothetical protein